MPPVWESPLYSLTAKSGKKIIVDVTSSVSAGLPPNGAISETMIPLFEKKKVRRILDFGAGALRHTLPLLRARFEVCAVEFELQFTRPACQAARTRAQLDANFSALIWPHQFKADGRKFDAALLCYVLQIMPKPKERELVLQLVGKKLRRDAYVLWMSRFGQLHGIPRTHEVGDGFYKWEDREHQVFYREFSTEETHTMLKTVGFTLLRNLSERGTDQVLLYGRGSSTWI